MRKMQRLSIIVTLFTTPIMAQTAVPEAAPGTVGPNVAQAPATAQPVQPQAGQNLKSESAPIHIMAQPPQTEFKDEFLLPDGASPELIAQRNLIDYTNSRINEIATEIDRLMASQSFESPVEEIKKLRAIQAAYESELKKLQQVQENFRSQTAVDTDKKYKDLKGNPHVSDAETSDLD